MTSNASTTSATASLQGKVAVVTGGTQGLGAAIALLLAERGARAVVTCGRNRDKGQVQAERIRQTGAQALYVPADLALVDDCRNVVQQADKQFGRVDILVNAAAITDRGTLLDTSPELFDRMFAINVRAPFFLMQEAVSVMRREKIEGNIVNIGSMSAMAGQPFLAAYCTSKGALATLTRNTAYGLLRNRIRVNGLNIGWMASDGAASFSVAIRTLSVFEDGRIVLNVGGGVVQDSTTEGEWEEALWKARYVQGLVRRD